MFPRAHGCRPFVATAAALMVLVGLPFAAITPAGAVEVPSVGGFDLQTNGPTAVIGLGDWYTSTAAGGGAGYGYLTFNVPCGWPAGQDLHVDLFSPEMNGQAGTLAQTEEPNGALDSTQFELYGPNVPLGPGFATPAPGTGIAGTQVTFPPVPAPTPQAWVRYQTLTAPVACGSYLLRSETIGNDQNGWRIRVGLDNDASPTTAPPANTDNPDGVLGTGDEISVGTIQTTYQHNGVSPTCQTFYQFVQPLPPGGTITFNNFDMDGNNRVRYYAPGSVVDPTALVGGVVGTVSGNTTWNGGGTLARAGDTIVDPANGWWAIVSCLNAQNQYILEGQVGVPAYFVQPPTPVLTIAKDDGLTIVSREDFLTYTLDVANVSTGVSAGAADNVVITDTLPTNSSFVSCAFVAPATGICSETAGVVTFTKTGDLDAGASFQVEVEVQVDTDAAGQLTNTTFVAYEDNIGNAFESPDATDVDDIRGTIGDTLWIDLDGNGLVDPGEPGLPGVTVELFDAGNVSVGTTVTDANGNYLFSVVNPGDYTAVVDLGTIPPGLVLTFEDDGTLNGSTTVNLASGDDELDVDFGFQGNASIGDTVWVDLNGNDVQDPGEPGVPGADIEAVWAGLDLTLGTADDVTFTGTTDANGIYLIDGLPAGDYQVTVVSGVPSGTTSTYDLDGGDDATATLTLGDDQDRTDVDFGFAGSSTIGDFVWFDQNGDGLQDPGEPGLSGIDVQLVWAGIDGIFGNADDVTTTDTTDASGGYSFTLLPAGSYEVSIDAGDLPLGMDASFDLDGPGTPNVANLILGANATNNDVDFGYVGTGSLGDLVWDDADGSGTVNGGELGITAVTIDVTWEGQDGILGTADDVTFFAITYPLVGWTVSGLPAGDYIVDVTGGVPAGYQPTYDLDGLGTPDTTVVTLGANQDRTDVDFGYQSAFVDLTIVKDDGAATATAGGTVTYTLTYDNVGTVTATGTTVTETVPVGTTFDAGGSTVGWSCADGDPAGAICTFALGAVAPGAGASIDFAVDVLDPVASGLTQLDNTASIDDDGTNGPDPTPADNTDDDDTPLDAEPDLTVTKDDGGATTVPGGLVAWQIDVENVGDQVATGVVLTETVPANTTFDAGTSSAGWSCADGDPAGTVCTLALGAVAPGVVISRLFGVTVDPAVAANVTQINNEVSVADDGTNGPDPTPGDNVDEDNTPLTAAPDLSILKDDGGASTTAGGIVVYTLDYANNGDQDATGVVITETVPADTVFDSAFSTAGWSCADGDPAGTICTFAIGALAVGATGSVDFAVEVDDPLAPGVLEIDNNTSIADDAANGPDPTPGDNTDDDQTPITDAIDLAITKDDGGATTAPGGTVAYTLNYENVGNRDATGVVLTDTVPANSTFNPGASTAGWVCVPGNAAGATCTLAIGNLAIGASGSATFAVTVSDPVPDGVSEIDNTASIADDGASGPDASPANNTDDDQTPVTAAPDLTIVKDDGGATTTTGGTVVYTLDYANVGNQPANAVVITETVPANTTFDLAGSSVGWSCADNAPAGTTCTLNVGTVAAGAIGSVTFAVTVDATVPAGVTVVDNSAAIADDGTNGPDPTPADNTDDDQTPLDAAPDLEIVKTDGGASTVPGGTVAYSLTVTNNGDQAATGVTISETVPANATFDLAGSSAGWSCADNSPAATVCTLLVGSLGAGASASRTFAVTVDDPLPGGVTQIDNTATVADDGTNGPDPTPGDNTDSDDTPVAASVDLAITKDDGGATTTPGGTVVYTLDYANNGNVGATGVVITETVPANATFDLAGSTVGWSCADNAPAATVCTFNVGAMAAGATGSVAFAVTVDAPLPATVDEIDNTTSIDDDGASGPDPTPGDNADGDDTPVAAAPDLSVVKDDGGATTTAGGTVTYALVYANNGDQDATSVELTETVPVGTTFDVAGSTVGWSCADNSPAGTTCTFTLGALDAGDGGSVNFAVTVDSPLPSGYDEVDNAVTIDDDGSNGPDPTPGDNADDDQTPVDAAPDLAVVKTDNGVSTVPGGSVTYELTATNNGDQDATGVVISETVPANSTFDLAGSTPGWSCADNAPAGTPCTFAIGSLAVGASTTVEFGVTVDDPFPAGTTFISNGVSVADDATNGPDPTPGDNDDEDTTPVVTAPDLSIAKDDGGATTTPGGVVVYTLDYANNGNDTATSVEITETVPLNTTFDAAGSTVGWSCADSDPAGTVCTLNIGAVAVGATGSVDFAVQVDAPLPAGVDQIDNSTSIENLGPQNPDPTPGDNTDGDDTPVTASPDLSIVKGDAGATVSPGGTITYTLDYVNNGDQAATGVTVTETVPASATFEVTGSTLGWSCLDGDPAGTVCTFAVGSLAVGATGSVTFVVTVDASVPAGTVLIDNSASVDDDGTNGPDPTPGDNDDDEDTPVDAAPDLTIVKDDGGISTTTGASFAYGLDYANVGNEDATGVTISETVPADTTFDAAGSTPGWSCADNSPAGTVCSFAVGALAVGGTGSVDFGLTVNASVAAGVTLVANTASIADDATNGPDPTPANNAASDDTPLAVAPDLSIVKDDGGATTTPGGVVVYTLDYANNGNVGATGVTITETVPDSTSFDAAGSTPGWSCVDGDLAGTVCTFTVGAVAAGATGSVDFAVQVDGAISTGVELIANTASIGDDGTNGPDPTPGDNTDGDDTPVTASPDLSIVKGDAGATVSPGGAIIYTLDYVNNGDQAATGVTVTETVPASTTFEVTGSTLGWSCLDGDPAGTVCTFAVGSLAVGAAGSLTFVVTVDPTLPSLVVDIDNTVSIDDDGTNGPDPTPGDNTDDEDTPVDAAPDLTVVKDDGGVSSLPGGTVVYTLDYANVGNQASGDPELSETVPANTTFDAAGSTPGWSCADNAPAGTVCELALGSLAAGATGSADFAVTIDDPLPAGVTQVANTVVIGDTGDDGPDPTPADNTDDDTTPVVAAPDLSIVKDDGGATTTPGGVVVYTLDYANNGNVGATGVTITETVPANATFDAAGSTVGWSCVDGDLAGTVCTFAVGSLAAGATGSVDFAVQVDAPLPAGVDQIDNSTSIDDDGANGVDPTPGDNTDDDDTPLDAAPDLSIAKDDGGGSTTPGGTVIYTLDYANNGLQDATDASVTETVPANTTFDLAGSAPGWSCADNSPAGTVCTFYVGDVGVGATGSLDFAVTVASPVPVGTTQVANTASISDPAEPDPTPGDNTDDDDTPIEVSSIGDHVFSDTNGNGVDDAEPGVSGATVTLTGTDTFGNPINLVTVTDGAGDYVFEGLAPGDYDVSISTLPAGAVPTFDLDGGLDNTTAVTLGIDESRDDVDFGVTLPGSISGTVFDDFDNDGVQDAGEPGIAGVAVTLTGTDGLGDPVNVPVVTDVDGNYTFVGLLPGTYVVTETQPATHLDGIDSLGSLGGTLGNDVVSAIVVESGETGIGYDFAEILASSISGSVLDAFAGTGIPGVTVTLTGTNDLGDPVNVVVVTDAAGDYSFGSLRPGDYTVTETQPAPYLDFDDVVGSLGGTPGNDVTSDIVVTPGDAGIGYDFTELAPSSISGVVFSDLDNDGVQDPGEPGIGGVTVTLTGTDDMGNPVNVVVVTDGNGTWSFGGLRPGDYTVTETQPVAFLDGIDTAGTAGGTLGNDVVSLIDLAPGVDATGYLFGELAPGSISGTVFDDVTTIGIPGVTVTLTGTDDLGNAVNVVVVTDGNGDYTIDDLRPGDYTVTETQPPAYLDGGDATGTLGGTTGNDVTSDIIVTPGANGTGYDFSELTPSSISGAVFVDADNDGVRDGGEAGIPGTTVTLTGTDDLGAPVNVVVVTDGNGDYTFDDLRPGDYSVTESQPASFLDGIDALGSAGGTLGNDVVTAITLPAGTVATGYTFGEVVAAALSGTVFDDDDNDGMQDGGESGIPGATITITGTDDLGNPVNVVVVTDANGDWASGDLRPGTYTGTETQPPGFLDGIDTVGSLGGTLGNDVITDIVLASGDIGTEYDFAEIAPGSISGTVFNDGDNDGMQDPGEPGIAGVTVTLTGTDDLGNLVNVVVVTDVDGNYVFGDVRPGTYGVVETQPAGLLDGIDTVGSLGGTLGPDTVADIVVTPGDSGTDYDFAELGLASISGIVFSDLDNDGVQDPGEPGIGGTTVTLTGTNDLGDPVNVVVVSDGSGAWSFAGLRPGGYTVTETQPVGFLDGIDSLGTAGGALGNDVATQISLANGQVATGYLFGEILPATISGSVLDDGTGNGIPGVTVTLTGTDDLGDPVNVIVVTDANGDYSFVDLRPGDYTVTETQPPGYLDGPDAVGSLGGMPGNDVTTNIPVAPGANGTGYDFVEVAPSSISGTAYLDADNDGVQDPGESGIAGVTVTLTGTDDLGAAVNVVVVTDASGNYSFVDVRPGDYTVTETQPAGFLDGIDTVGSLGGTLGNDTFAAITVVSGDTGIDYDFGELVGGAITGTVFDDVDNDGVQDPGESGIPGVTVTLTGTDDLGTPVNVVVVTDAAGDWVFADLRPGVYDVTETQPAAYLDGIDTVGIGGGTLGNDVVTGIVISSGTEAEAYLFGEILPATIGGSTFDDVDNDGVQDPGELGIGGVTVTLTGTDDLGNPVNVVVVTDTDGNYTFVDVRPGEYVVTETQPAGFLDGIDTVGSLGGTLGDDTVTAIIVEPGDTGIDYDFAEFVAASISGTVFNDVDNDGVLDAGEAGIPGATVTLSGTDDLGDLVNVVVVTDANGTWSFPGLRPGDYTVTETQPAGFLDGIDTAGTTGGTLGNDVVSDIVLVPGGAGTGYLFGEIAPATISGSVYDDVDGDGVQDPGEPGIGGTTVTLTGSDDLGDPVNVVVVTDVDGNYTFVDVRPGEYAVTETQPAGFLDGTDVVGSLGGDLGADTVTSITVVPGDTGIDYDFAETAPASISGTVFADLNNDGVQDADDAGIADVIVTLTGVDGLGNVVDLSTTTDVDGNYSFDGLLPGTYVVTETQPADLLDGLDTVGSLGGSLGADTVTAITVPSGGAGVTYDFAELPPASISGWVYDDVDDDGVKDAGEVGIGGVTITLTGIDDLGNAVELTTTTAADGSWSFTGLRPGTYQVAEAQPAGYDDGKDTPGTAGGTGGDDVITSITLGAGVVATDYVFGEHPQTFADVSIVKAASTPQVATGGVATYTLTVTNNGPDAAEDVVVTDTVPTGLTPVTATGTDWTCTITGQTITCTIADPVASGVSPAPLTVTATVTATAGTTVRNVASVTSSTTDRIPDNNSDDADITVSTTPAPAPAPTPGSLPVTGGDPWNLVRTAGVLLLVGGVLLLAGWRRRRSEA